MVQRLPKILAILGAGATIIALVAAGVIEQLSLRGIFDSDYVWMEYVVLPMLCIGVPAGFFGAIWWARRWNLVSRIRTAVALFVVFGAILMFRGNIHGAGGLVLVISFPLLLLGIVLLIFGLFGNAST